MRQLHTGGPGALPLAVGVRAWCSLGATAGAKECVTTEKATVGPQIRVLCRGPRFNRLWITTQKAADGMTEGLLCRLRRLETDPEASLGAGAGSDQRYGRPSRSLSSSRIGTGPGSMPASTAIHNET